MNTMFSEIAAAWVPDRLEQATDYLPGVAALHCRRLRRAAYGRLTSVLLEQRAEQPTIAPSMDVRRELSKVGTLRTLLLAEAVAGVVLAVVLSSLAAGVRGVEPADIGAETGVRFAASAAFVFAIAAAVAARGVRRRRSWSWTLAAILQLALALGGAAAVLAADWHPAYLASFAVAGVLMLVLSTSAVRRALGQE